MPSSPVYCLVPQAYDWAGLTGTLAQVWVSYCALKLRAAAPAAQKGAVANPPSAPASTSSLPASLGQQSATSFVVIRPRAGIKISVKNLTDHAITVEVESSGAIDMARSEPLSMTASPLARRSSPFPTSCWRRPVASRLPTLPLPMSPLQSPLPACSLPRQPPSAARQQQAPASNMPPASALPPW